MAAQKKEDQRSTSILLGKLDCIFPTLLPRTNDKDARVTQGQCLEAKERGRGQSQEKTK